MKRYRKPIRVLQVTLAAAAVVLLGIYAAATWHRLSGRAALREFDIAKAKGGASADRQSLPLSWPSRVDFSLWSEKRVLAYRESLSRSFGAMAVLTVPRFNIRVPVVEGTDEFALNRGVGWIAGTARPGERGNVGIAGHRDGFFRALKDIGKGDEIGIETLDGFSRYRVDQIQIVTPNDVWVLGERQADAVTLVTCYPFYFVGDAPQRFIVHASLERDGTAGETLNTGNTNFK
jgi:sortase A